jgi:membrane protein
LLQWLRWPLLFASALLGLEILYTLGPCRKRTKWGVSAGGVAATLLWIGGSSLFSLFMSHFSNFNQMYGSLGAVVVLMLWFWVSALTILMGAEINGALEKNQKPLNS